MRMRSGLARAQDSGQAGHQRGLFAAAPGDGRSIPQGTRRPQAVPPRTKSSRRFLGELALGGAAAILGRQSLSAEPIEIGLPLA
jgi:hypothetical protein